MFVEVTPFCAMLEVISRLQVDIMECKQKESNVQQKKEFSANNCLSSTFFFQERVQLHDNPTEHFTNGESQNPAISRLTNLNTFRNVIIRALTLFNCVMFGRVQLFLYFHSIGNV